MQGVTEGRIVHYVLSKDRGDVAESSHGQHRPAIIVRTFDGLREQGTVNLQVFCDGGNDGSAMLWKTSVLHDPDGAPGTWHWIERA